MSNYIHDHKDFAALINILAEEKKIEPGLIEKDYWIMHVLYGLKKQDFNFELKGGTSLSKGFKIIDRFSEDIDIHIQPPAKFEINENPKNTNKNNAEKRKSFYDWLATEIKIAGIIKITRDIDFDDIQNYRSGGIRLFYNNMFDQVEGVKEGILLEAGFDDITPNTALSISSWAYDKAIASKVDIIDNRATEIICYHPGYTLVEKLQTIATKFRNEHTENKKGVNFMRQYYDIYCLLGNEEVLDFISTPEYAKHKEKRFPTADFQIPIKENEAFILSSKDIRRSYEDRYKKTASLYYLGQPDFNDIISRIGNYIDIL